MKLKKKFLSLAVSLMLFTGFAASSNAASFDSIQRLKGSDRYATASAIAGSIGSYDTVILVNADNNKLADGLSASGLAGVVKAPILLVHKDSIPNETQLRIDIAKKIYIIGSTNSISDNLENKLRDENMGGFNVKRIGGKDRFETSSNIAKEILNIKGSIGKVFVANGYKGEADAMSISAVAARDGEPIILTNGSTLTDASAGVVEQTKNIYAVGGRGNIQSSLVSSLGATRISGSDRYSTNSAVINEFYREKPTRYYLSDGYKLVDALTGGPLAGRNISPIVLVGLNSNKSVLKGANQLVALGGIPDSVLKQCAQATN